MVAGLVNACSFTWVVAPKTPLITMEERQAGWAEVAPKRRKVLIGGGSFSSAEFEAKADAQACPEVRQILEAKRRSKLRTFGALVVSTVLYGGMFWLLAESVNSNSSGGAQTNAVLYGAALGGVVGGFQLARNGGESQLDWDGAVAAYNDCKASSTKTKGNHD
jgi:hypothetical protein